MRAWSRPAGDARQNRPSATRDRPSFRPVRRTTGTAPSSSAPAGPAATRRCARPAGSQGFHQLVHAGAVHRFAGELVLDAINLTVVGSRPPFQVGELAGMVLLLAGHPDIDRRVFGHGLVLGSVRCRFCSTCSGSVCRKCRVFWGAGGDFRRILIRYSFETASGRPVTLSAPRSASSARKGVCCT